MTENNGKKNPEETYTSKYQKHIACSYGCKLVCVNDKLNKPFKTYLGENTVYNSINSMDEEIKYCSEVIEKRLNKELVLTKEDNILNILLNVGSAIMIILILLLK